MTKSKIIIIVSCILILATIGFFVAKSCCDKGACSHTATADGHSKHADCTTCGEHTCTKACEPSDSATNSGISEKVCATKSTEELKSEEEAFKQMGVFKKISAVNELPTGYELIYKNPTEELAIELIDFIKLERKCCPTYDYAFIVDANTKTIRYQRYGSAEIKAEQKVYLKKLGLLK